MNAKILAMVMVKGAQISLAHINVNVSQDTFQMAQLAEVNFCPCTKARNFTSRLHLECFNQFVAYCVLDSNYGTGLVHFSMVFFFRKFLI